jgi:hypothetical protein
MSKQQPLPKSLQKIENMAENVRSTMDEDAASSKAQKGGNKKGGNKDFMVSVADVPYSNLQELYTDLLEQYRKAVEEKEEISATAQRRQETYLRKEQKYKEQLGSLEERINNINVDDPKGDIRMDYIRTMHTEIQSTIGLIQGKTSQILQDQERDLIRAFRARLADVTDELEKERKKNESGSVEWVQRCRKLTEELEWLRDLTDKLTAENKNYLKENRRFKRQLKTQEEDREFLIKQLVCVKKENARLRYSFEQSHMGGAKAMEEDPGTPSRRRLNSSNGFNKTSPQPMGGMGSRPGSADGQFPPASPSGLGNSNGDDRYRALLLKARKRNEDLENKIRGMKTMYTAEVGQRTELQNFLKKCIDDVKQDIAQRTKKRQAMSRRGGSRLAQRGNGVPNKPPMDPRDIPLSDFTSTDRINVMEWLLSQDAVMFMLYDKMFPRKGASQGSKLSDSIDFTVPMDDSMYNMNSEGLGKTL